MLKLAEVNVLQDAADTKGVFVKKE